LRCTNAHAQERRTSARRGQGIAPAAPSVSCRMRMLAYHGGLTPPALGGSAVRTFAGETATCAIHERSLTRAAGVSPPWYVIRPLRRENRRLLGKCRTHNRERPTSARRDPVPPAQSQMLFADRLAPRTTAGLRQPLLKRQSAYLTTERSCPVACYGWADGLKGTGGRPRLSR
jgi:hypothetical protein